MVFVVRMLVVFESMPCLGQLLVDCDGWTFRLEIELRIGCGSREK